MFDSLLLCLDWGWDRKRVVLNERERRILGKTMHEVCATQQEFEYPHTNIMVRLGYASQSMTVLITEILLYSFSYLPPGNRKFLTEFKF